MEKEKLSSLAFSCDRKDSNLDKTSTQRIFPGSPDALLKQYGQIEADELHSEIDCRYYDWEFRCPKNWYWMEETGTEGQRFCGECKRKVYTAYSEEELACLVAQGKCVRVFSEGTIFLGLMAPIPYTTEDEIRDSEILLISIWEVIEQLEQSYKTNRRYEDALVVRLGRMRERFVDQIHYGLRDCNSLLHEQYFDCQSIDSRYKNREISDGVDLEHIIEKVLWLLHDPNWVLKYLNGED